jgi:uncharacterized protein with PIN domain
LACFGLNSWRYCAEEPQITRPSGVFGRGRGHPAALNFGDPFSYALAKVQALPLLFKGNDFSETDIVPAVSVAHE